MTKAGQNPDRRVPRARRLRRDATEAERKLWPLLRQLPLAKSHFRRQATIGPYYADFACHRLKLVIELDGGQHADAKHVANDERRSAYLAAAGYRVLRFWNNEVLANPEGVLSAITDVIADEVPPTPDPSPPFASLTEGGEPAHNAHDKCRQQSRPKV